MMVATKDQMMTRPALIGIGAVLVLSIAVAVVGRRAETVVGDPLPLIEKRELVFADRADGGLEVFDARSRKAVLVVEPGVEGTGFMRQTMRGFARERKRVGKGPEEAFLLARDTKGIVHLEDPATGRRVVLSAFGSTNAQSFARLLGEGRKSP